jgi:hypothetical protein
VRHVEARRHREIPRAAIAQDARSETISALTRVHSPSKTGVNALIDALWRNPPIAHSVGAIRFAIAPYKQLLRQIAILNYVNPF